MLDPLNYRGQVRGIFHRHGWDEALTDAFARRTGDALARLFQGRLRQPRPAAPDA
jgi:hypothetical protein